MRAPERVRVSAVDFHADAEAIGLDRSAAEGLWARLADREGGPVGRFDGPNVAYYFGGLLVIAACSWLLGEGWVVGGPGVGLAGALLLAAALVFGSRSLLRRGWRVPAGLLATAVVALVPLIVFAFQQTTGWWPDTGYGEYPDFYAWISARWLVMEVATVVAALVALRLTRFPFLWAPLAFVAWFASMDLTPVLFGPHPGSGQRAGVALAVAAAMLAGALVLDRLGRRSEAFWLYLFGLETVTGVAVYAAAEHGELGWTLTGLAGVGLIAASVPLDRRIPAVFGGLFVFAWTSHLAYSVFHGSILFPLALAALGGATIAGGIALARRRHVPGSA
jgi:hypothetical protein